MNTLTLLQAVEEFLAGLAGEVSASTRRWYDQRLSRFCEFVGPVPVTDVSPGTIRAYRAHLVDRELSIHYIHGCQRALRRLFSWLAPV